MSEYRLKSSAFLQEQGQLGPKFQYKGSSPTNHSTCQKTRMIDLSYGIKMWAEVSFIILQCAHLMDGEISIAAPCICIRSHMVKWIILCNLYSATPSIVLGTMRTEECIGCIHTYANPCLLYDIPIQLASRRQCS